MYGTFHSVSRKHLHRYVAELISAGARASWTMACGLRGLFKWLSESGSVIVNQSSKPAN
jgi:hypothetical protein